MKISKEEKTMWLEDWKQSGKGAWAYAKENGLTPQTFCNWVNREAKEATGFVEVAATKESQKEQAAEIIVEKGEVRIRIPILVWEERPEAVMEILKAVAA